MTANSSHYLPHRGQLIRENESLDSPYVIPIRVPETESFHRLVFCRRDLEFAQNLFAIVDTENRGWVIRESVREFAMLRCPVFWRRDDDLRRLGLAGETKNKESLTFDEIWRSVLLSASNSSECGLESSTKEESEIIGIEGWLVFCRMVALAQYLEAKRRFSARHLQQTMRHRNAPRGSEVVMVDVPPADPPTPLSVSQLADYERKNKIPLPLPELDLDHSLVAAHDLARHQATYRTSGRVKVSLFGAPLPSKLLPANIGASASATKALEFALTFTKTSGTETVLSDEIEVRRSMEDLKWLDETFASHKVLGGTLCGRILPPFPGGAQTASSTLASHFQKEDSVINASIKRTGGAINAAAAGVGIVRDVAKSLFGSYNESNKSSSQNSKHGIQSEKPSGSIPLKKSSKKSSVNAAISIPESYYNPNSPVFKGRQLERYLNYLLEHPALSTSFPLNTILQASQSGLDAAKVALAECHRLSKERSQQAPKVGGDDKAMTWTCVSPESSNFAWVRTAAQAAMALKVHGMLETTGLQSASARLQHASLPSFGRDVGREEDDGYAQQISHSPLEDNLLAQATCTGNDFEEGVVNVDGDDGYDLLPLPVPAPERRILSAGSGLAHVLTNTGREERFHYGTVSDGRSIAVEAHNEDDGASAFLGDISVDENIDKLREVIGSVDSTLTRCLGSVGRIGKAQKERQSKHLEIVGGFDSWEGMRGRFVSQRSLMKGVPGIGQSREVYEESDLAFIDDLSWQASLAASAVAAAEDVRKAVRVSKTASSAKAAASAAAFSAQTVCESGEFSSMDEARAAQTRASISQSHAIHAAVIEHEANSVKRRAALALAHDVKCWNIHRKREMLNACLSYARSQHEAARRSVDAWSSLRDGFIVSPVGVMPSVKERKPTSQSLDQNIQGPSRSGISTSDYDEVSVRIFENPSIQGNDNPPCQGNDRSLPTIVAVDHKILSVNSKKHVDQVEFVSDTDSFFPLVTAAPIFEERTRDVILQGMPDFHQEKEDISRAGEDAMSTSMQSLVDGLMSWGGGFENEEEHFALPVGMARNIVQEQTSALEQATV